MHDDNSWNLLEGHIFNTLMGSDQTGKFPRHFGLEGDGVITCMSWITPGQPSFVSHWGCSSVAVSEFAAKLFIRKYATNFWMLLQSMTEPSSQIFCTSIE